MLKEQKHATITTFARTNVEIRVAQDVQLLLQCHQEIQTLLLVVIKKDFLIFVK